MRKLSVILIVLGLVIVSAHFVYAAEDKNMVLYMSFNEGDGNEVKDGSMYGNHGEIVDDANTEWADGKYGSGIEITAKTADPVVIPNSDSLMITEAISMLAWIKPEAWSGEGHNQLLDKRCHNGGETNLCYGLDTGQGTMIGFMLGTGGARVAANGNTPLELGEWQHIAGSYDDGDGGSFYLNGDLIGEAPATGEFQGTNEFEVRIGGARDRAHYGWVGSIDEFYIFDRAVSDAEVKAIMNDGFISVSPKDRLTTTWASIKAD